MIYNRTDMPAIAPSILSADFAHLGDALDVVASGTNRIHVDVMDGIFVPNLTIGPPVVASLRKHSGTYLDCHLMCSKPEVLIDAFVKAGANAITVHVELEHIDSLLDQIKDLGVDVGISLNPDTDAKAIEPYLEKVDLILFMSVFPGFGGQKFIPDVLNKVVHIGQICNDNKYDIVFSIDGGINKETIADASRAGCEVFVAGNAVYAQDDPLGALKELKRIAYEAKLEK